jgi:hypothetical protein
MPAAARLAIKQWLMPWSIVRQLLALLATIAMPRARQMKK